MIKPMLAKATKNLLKVKVEDYVAERKFDGERMLAIMKDGVVTLQRRSDKIATHQYPELVESLELVAQQGDTILDGEVVVWDGDKDDFDGVAQRSHHKDLDKINAKKVLFPATYMMFDVLEVKGQSTVDEPLWARRIILNDILSSYQLSMSGANKTLFQTTVERDVAKLWNESKEKKWEGIILKDKNSSYILGGRRKEWLKLKNVYEADLLFNSYEVNNAGILLIKDQQFGVDDTEVNATEKSPIKVQCSGEQSKEVKEWLDDMGEAFVTVEYLNMTKDNKLRMPTFKKLVVK